MSGIDLWTIRASLEILETLTHLKLFEKIQKLLPIKTYMHCLSIDYLNYYNVQQKVIL